jgi:hypothetical protein
MATHELVPANDPILDPTMTAAADVAAEAAYSVPETHEELLKVELVLCHNPNSDTWRQAEDNEYDNFKAAGYVGSREEMREIYKPYEPVSQMIVSKHAGKVVGSVRMITYDESIGFKTINDALKAEGEKDKLELSPEGWEAVNRVDPRTMVEVGTLSLDEDYRTTPGASEHMVTSLYGIIYARTLAMGTPNIIASFDEDFFGRFKGLFGPAIKEIGPALDMMGSKTVPSLMNTGEIEDYFRAIGIGDYVDELAAYGTLLTEEY